MTKTQQPVTQGGTSQTMTSTTASTRSGKRKGSEWEILGSLEKGVAYTIKPKRYETHLLKRRKWPLKGWHKRFFVMDQGVLFYGKSSADISRGRTLGITVGQSDVFFIWIKYRYLPGLRLNRFTCVDRSSKLI